MAGVVTCPRCGRSWWSEARSQTTRCRCRQLVYVPAVVRNAPESCTQGDHARPTCGLRHAAPDLDQPRSIGSSPTRPPAPQPSPSPASTRPTATTPPSLPSSWAPGRVSMPLTIGESTVWLCGHEAMLAATGDWDPPVVACPKCGRRGILAHRIDGGLVAIKTMRGGSTPS